MFPVHLPDRACQSVAAAAEGESGAWLEHVLECVDLSSRAGLATELVASAHLLNGDVFANFMRSLGGLYLQPLEC